MDLTRKLFLLCALTLLGCIKTSSTNALTQNEITLRWAVDTLPLRAEPNDCHSKACFQYAYLVMDGLFRPEAIDSGSWHAVPSLAETLIQTAPRTFRITLKSQVHWSDGTPFSAHDVILTWKTLAALPPSSKLASRFLRGTTFNAVSPTEIELQFTHPISFIERKLAHPALWPRRTASNASPPSLGPYIESAKDRFSRNPFFHGSRPSIEAFRFVLAEQASERLELVREGSVEIAEWDPSSEPTVEGPSLMLSRFPTQERLYLLFNSVIPPMQSPGTRQFFIQSLDLNEPLQALGLGLQVNRSLASETSLRTESKARTAANQVPVTPAAKGQKALELWVEKDAASAPLATNFKMQWQSKSGYAIRILNSATSPLGAPLKLVSWKSDWHAPSLPPFLSLAAPAGADEKQLFRFWTNAQTLWVDEQALVLPLYEKCQLLAVSPRLAPIHSLPLGGWDYGRVSSK
jgi:ABC-type transport system substrate-binding protein